MILLLAPAFALDITLNPGDDIITATSALGPGDVVTFNPGTYTIDGPVTWTGLGTEQAPITIKGTGDVVIEAASGWAAAYVTEVAWMTIRGIHFRGAETSTDDHDAMAISGADHLTIEDCEFGPALDDGVSIGGAVSALTFRHNHVHDMADGNGLYVGCYDASCWAQDSTFEANWIHNIGGDYHYGLYFAPGAQGNVIRDNVVYQVTYGGILVGSTEYGDPNTVEGNAVWNVASYGIGAYGASLVRNNVVFNITGKGIVSGQNDRGTTDHVVISHNTVVDTSDYGIQVESWAGLEGMVLANNAVANTTGLGLNAPAGAVDDAVYVSHNVVSGLVTGLLQYAGTTDPYLPGGGGTDFVDTVSWDFYPSSDSTLRDAGDASSAAWVPETDFNGAARDGASPDAGAYEYDGEGNPGWLIAEGFKDVGALSDRPDDTVGGGCCGGKSADGAEALLLLPLAALGFRRRVRAVKAPA